MAGNQELGRSKRNQATIAALEAAYPDIDQVELTPEHDEHVDRLVALIMKAEGISEEDAALVLAERFILAKERIE